MTEWLFGSPYTLILAITILLSPFIITLASKQSKKTKQQLKFVFLLILSAQIFLGFLNWENFSVGRGGFELSLAYPNSFLGFFFIISVIQISLLIFNKSFNTLVIILNFINTVLIFIGMIKLSNISGFQAVSFASVGAVFLVLTGNIVGLAFINKDKNLLKKYFKLF